MSDKKICSLTAGGWSTKPLAGGLQPAEQKQSKKVNNQITSDKPFSDQEIEQIREGIYKKYTKVASSASGLFKYSVGKEGALALGYDSKLLQNIPDNLLESFCGVGNPFSLGPIRPGAQVLDIGCGGGFDLYIAAKKSTSSGKATGVDLTEQMVVRAKENLKTLGVKNAEVLHIQSEDLPFDDNTFDHIISNGVINLSPRKRYLFKDIYRVLKPHGTFQFADIILENELPPHLAVGVESWSQWIGGAIPGRDQVNIMIETGFSDARQCNFTPVKTSPHTIGATFFATKP